MSKAPEVLIVGAGPTGLVLALWLTRAGVPVRIVDKQPGPGLASRAMVVQARTLELYRQLGIADQVVASGIEVEEAHWRFGIRRTAVLNIRNGGKGISPYPFALSFPQDDHEKLLHSHLSSFGMQVEWETELVDFQDSESGITAVLRHAGKDENVRLAYLCGCDGAHSTVRHALQMEFPGGTYEQIFYVADVDAEIPGDEHIFTIYLGPRGFDLVFPIRSTGMKRLIGIVPRTRKPVEELTFEDIRAAAQRRTGVRVKSVNWFSPYRVHHRVAAHFRKGRVFLAGDAGHIHSPAGGQGMNTGIGDAVNLAWKLAAVLRDNADPALLDTYEPERIAFAQSLVATTDRIFKVAVGQRPLSRSLRRWLPRTLPIALRFAFVRRAAFLLISQIRVHYERSPLSAGSAVGIDAGDRLPWVEKLDNFDPLKERNWQWHVYGTAGPQLRDLAERKGLPLHEYAWIPGLSRVGLNRDVAYLVRPDGYVGLVSADQDADEALAYCEKWGIGD